MSEISVLACFTANVSNGQQCVYKFRAHIGIGKLYRGQF